METNRFTNRISILLALTAITFFPFFSKAQLFVNTANNVGIGISTPGASLDIPNGNYAVGTAPTLTLGATIGTKVRTNSTRKLSSITQYPQTNANAPYLLLGGDAESWYNAVYLGGGFNGYNAATQLSFFTAATTNVKSGTERMRIDFNGNIGMGINPVSGYRLYVSGNFYVEGTTSCTSGAWYSSDQQFKTNIDSIPNALSLINQLKPRSYYFDTTNVYDLNFSNLKQYGLIAQDVEQLLPELVSLTTKPADIDTLGNVVHPAVTYKSLNYNAFIGIILQGIKDQSSKIDTLSEELLTEKGKTNNQDSIITSLQNQMNTLASMINSCCDNNHDNGNHNGHRAVNSYQTNIELNDSQSIVLQQNVPNPFAEQTTISYSLPDNTVKAQMLFYNAQGKLIQSTELTQKGKGTLNVFASDLSNGIYTYTLVVDGKIIETKKMVKQ